MRRASALARAALALGVLPLGACVGEVPPPEPTPVELEAPPGFPPMVVPDENPTTLEGIALGRRLYYDRRLSRDGTRACADCHHQERSF